MSDRYPPTAAHAVAERERAPLPPKRPVPFADYAALREAAGHAAESLTELLQAMKFYEPEGKVARKAQERLARLRALGAVR